MTCFFYMPLHWAFNNPLGQKKLKFLLDDKLPHFNKNKYEFVFHNSRGIHWFTDLCQ